MKCIKNRSGKEFQNADFHSNSVVWISTLTILLPLSQNALCKTWLWIRSQQVPSPLGTTVWFQKLFSSTPTTVQCQPYDLPIVLSVQETALPKPCQKSWTLSWNTWVAFWFCQQKTQGVSTVVISMSKLVKWRVWTTWSPSFLWLQHLILSHSTFGLRLFPLPGNFLLRIAHHFFFYLWPLALQTLSRL